MGARGVLHSPAERALLRRGLGTTADKVRLISRHRLPAAGRLRGAKRGAVAGEAGAQKPAPGRWGGKGPRSLTCLRPPRRR